MIIRQITLPLSVTIPRKTKADKKYIINLNNYPHWHFITYRNIKKIYCEMLEDKLKGIKYNEKIDLTYIYYKGSNRSCDKANVLAVQDKFFCDALVHHGCIEDDNDKFIGDITFKDGGIDKENPRIEVFITNNIITKR